VLVQGFQTALDADPVGAEVPAALVDYPDSSLGMFPKPVCAARSWNKFQHTKTKLEYYLVGF
jgi:hypothetical protein